MMKPKLKFILNPLYWPLWLVLGFTWIISLLPFSVLMALGRCIGRIAYMFPSYSKTVANINLKLCFPELDHKQREKLLKENFQAMGMAYMETIFAWWASKRRLRSLLKINNEEVLLNAQKQKQGVLLIVPHMLTLELTGRLTGEKIPQSTVYRPHRKAFLDMIVRWHFDNCFEEAIPRHDIRRLVKALKAGKTVLFLPDIDGGRKQSVFSPFFGVQAATIISVSRIANMSGAKVVTAESHRTADNNAYEVTYSEYFENYPSDNVQQDVDYMNQVFETSIRKAPEQYLWTYRRFYTRPEGEARLYPSQRSRCKAK